MKIVSVVAVFIELSSCHRQATLRTATAKQRHQLWGCGSQGDGIVWSNACNGNARTDGENDAAAIHCKDEHGNINASGDLAWPLRLSLLYAVVSHASSSSSSTTTTSATTTAAATTTTTINSSNNLQGWEERLDIAHHRPAGALQGQEAKVAVVVVVVVVVVFVLVVFVLVVLVVGVVVVAMLEDVACDVFIGVAEHTHHIGTV
ncbi:unnamed protein product [Polarella glacialis]|uniref:Uncharacterized protein n=1 Tax=Polarella glacialis TaxID=89957 RepID=A0A813E5P6_POLGL|nr:unnamed protein product [Polarella glacialis]CAE8647878.1 unnamed protein product [Polarella glacialis]